MAELKALFAAQEAIHARYNGLRRDVRAKYTQMDTEAPLTDVIALMGRQNAFIAETDALNRAEQDEIEGVQK